MNYIDLFAGLGGFHVGLERLGHKCVFASEIDRNLSDLYETNFNLRVAGDIRKIALKDIPKHDILCAGFPCQSFSQAGNRLGLKDNRGSLFYEIVRILEYHKPKFFILENVPNLFRHNSGKTWKTIERVLTKKLGYHIDKDFLSPHHFGVPQYRKRLFIVGSRVSMRGFNWPERINNERISINSILDKNPKSAKKLPRRELECIRVWQKFITAIPKNEELPSFPIWTTEFGATYPYNGKPPILKSKSELAKFRGSFGVSLKRLVKTGQIEKIPKYARDNEVFPQWKQDFIRQNREFYIKFKKQIDPLLPRIKELPFSWQKFEWNCNGERRDLSKMILQFRASGIRVKRPNFSPSLISSTSTQIPIITWEKRYMTPKEAAKLQSLERLELFPSQGASFKALGNAVNAEIVYQIAKRLIRPHKNK